MDLFDLAPPGEAAPPLARICAPALVVGVSSDVLFPAWQQRELAERLEAEGCPVTWSLIDGHYGHDTFLIDRQRIGAPLRAHLEAEG